MRIWSLQSKNYYTIRVVQTSLAVCCRVTVLEEELGRMSPDLSAIEAYRKKEGDYNSRVKELEAATEQRDEVDPLSDLILFNVILIISYNCYNDNIHIFHPLSSICLQKMIVFKIMHFN